MTQESLLRYTPCWCATFLIAELLVKPWWLLDSIADYNALWSYVTFVSFLFAQDNSWFRLWPCSKAEAYKLVLQRLGWDCLHPFYRRNPVNPKLCDKLLLTAIQIMIGPAQSPEVQRDFVELLRGNYGFTLPFVQARTGFAAFVLHLAGLGWENKVALIYGLAPARRKDCHKRSQKNICKALEYHSTATWGSVRGLRAPLQSPPPTLISSSRYQVACFAALTLAYTIAGNQVRQTGTVKQDKKGTLLHRLRTMFYCRCQVLSRAFDSCDSIAQTFVFEALISCVDSLARAGDPCIESLRRIQGAVAPPAKPCALLSLPLSLTHSQLVAV